MLDRFHEPPTQYETPGHNPAEQSQIDIKIIPVKPPPQQADTCDQKQHLGKKSQTASQNGDQRDNERPTPNRAR
ncbi:hypothetical protein KSB_43000 [Ktedonobacter robiniae]|uniref:Uncharacterized protein n=1 Tax=Ktedonobacter robiniae TaxID=2778365 RepID=A0ABQ3UTX2_9CHLR|nr:hypothetical protein KSB_43000 [Ktedonobacter robiniae]